MALRRQNFAKRDDDLRCNYERLRAMKAKRIDWLKQHRAEIEHMTPTALALRMQREGLYSKRTAVIDIKMSLTRVCSSLGIVCSSCPSTYSKAHGCYLPENRYRR